MVTRRTQSLWIALLAALCVLAGCSDKKVDDATCKGDDDCEEGLHCVNQQCLVCGDDSHCPEGQSCQSGACVATEPICSSDADCPAGQACVDGGCRACDSDDQCGLGGKCNNGECERATACTQDTDCADDEDCVDGYCQKPWLGEAPDVECALPTVYFDFDEAGIRDDAREVLTQAAECIRQAPADSGVYVEGHTDGSGTEEYNVALSERRARTVTEFLERLGIDPGRFSVIAKGEGVPSGEGTDKDRRVEFQWR
ncbi:OmpA family protein [Haliangium ochraceum]|uniref:OmpA/MotB domain protein n=1 Tax=Haliangium ochraceum (strain DSM 14365 / JCM 11303 / SMP-2) TaxID=502025 RepID=D0LFM5_HALO1|nr:OmpA family protein [Haliangium ochraceum]ACY12659.1 OmpA/MotB domain protein [Haliangium ochraceum DSM 14365]